MNDDEKLCDGSVASATCSIFAKEGGPWHVKPDPRPTVWTFYGDESEVEAILLGPPSSTGLCKLSYKNTTFVRHVSRLVPKSEAAHTLLAGNKDVARDL